MRRSFTARIAMVLLLASLSAAPAIAAPRDDSPSPVMDRIVRFMQKIEQTVRTILDTPTASIPPG